MGLIEGLRRRVDQLVNNAKRATAGPALARAVVAVAAFVSLMIAYPPGVLGSRAPLLFAVIAVVPALFPRTAAPTAVMFAAVLGWFATGAGFDVRATTFARLVALAASLYLVHTGSALAAALPYDAIMTPDVFTPWLIRTVAVLALTGLFAVLAADLPSFAHGRRAVIAAIGGVLVTLAITGYLRWLGSRRPGG